MTSHSALPSRLFAVGLIFFLSLSCTRHEEPTPVIETIGFGSGGVELRYKATYIGSAKCGTCHAEHRRLQEKHNMALTSRRVTAENQDLWFSPGHIEKPLDWPSTEPSPPPRYRREPAGVFLEAPGAGGAARRAQVAAVFGSGRHGFTPISIEAGRGMRELRVSYFESGGNATGGKWMLTPGDAGDPEPLGYVRSLEMTETCLGCHTTVLAWREERLDLDASVFGIGCERCHGPGSAHVEAVVAGNQDLRIFNPGALRADEEVKFCGQCHRRPAELDPQNVLKGDPEVARHAGAALMLSACFRRSPPEAAIHCLECHNTHRNIDRSMDDFNRPCLRCHQTPGEAHRSKEVSALSDCVSCHMPVEKRGFFGMAFTDHWIRVPGSPPPAASETKREEYARHQEAAYLAELSRPGVRPEKAARLRMRLGDLLFAEGKLDRALEWLRQALTFAPLYRDRIVAAELHERAGKRKEAIQILTEAIRQTPENNRAYYTLAKIHIAALDFGEAEKVLAAWQQARPGDPVIQEVRGEMERLRRKR